MNSSSTPTSPTPADGPKGTPSERRHDLDALRAAAMLLGIVYHASLSFALGAWWMIQDVSQSKILYLFQAFVHGFRMQLFMLVSGFFTAMLWRQKGLRALLQHRFRRVLLPCLLGLITVVPAMIWSSGFATRTSASRHQAAARAEAGSASLWAAIRNNETAAVLAHLGASSNLTQLHPTLGVTPLTWAVILGQTNASRLLLERGADPNGRNRDGNTPLHAAAFLGHTQAVHQLTRAGADVNITNPSGESPLQSARADMGAVDFIAGLFGITVDHAAVKQGRTQAISDLKLQGAREPGGTSGAGGPGGNGDGATARQIYKGLTETPVFILIWFLWFLVWLLALFAIYATLSDRLGWGTAPSRLLASPARMLWLVPLTMIPAWYMGFGNGEFGPDTSMGIVPMPHVLAYYILFFFGGVFLFDCRDQLARIGRGWRWSLPLALLVVFPVALETATGTFGVRDSMIPKQYHQFISVLFQAVYAWMLSFGCMGMFRSLIQKEIKSIRYLSDASYWMYLAHLPITIAAQTLICDWPIPAIPKLALLSIAVTASLLLSYQLCVRYTWIGSLLNGPRKRPGTENPSASGIERSAA